MPQNNQMKWALGAAAFAALCLLGLITLLMIGSMNTGLPGLIVGMIMAVLPVPFYVAMALWVDRYEKEPRWMLAAAFLWGATGAVFFAFIFNSINAAIFGAVGGQTAAGLGGSVISAPFVEELAKGVALFLFFFWKKDEFDDVIDGIVYAAMVGLGFAMTENVSYYGQALQGGLGGTFFVRGVLAPFSHPLFTAMTGIGLGLSRETVRKQLKVIAPWAGLSLAMALHATWNLSASFGAAFLLAYLLIMMPAFFGLLGVVLYAQARERKIIRANLMPYVQSGHIYTVELETLCRFGGRMKTLMAAMQAQGAAGWKREARFQQAASELAFHRWRTERGISKGVQEYTLREAEYLQVIATCRAQPVAAQYGTWAGA
ncbi:MAG TPA: PrsW family intramembrane metalloprotease [Longimicrobiaceae bacterium]